MKEMCLLLLGTVAAWLFVQVFLTQYRSMSKQTEYQLYLAMEELHYLQKQNIQLERIATELNSAEINNLQAEIKNVKHRLQNMQMIKIKKPYSDISTTQENTQQNTQQKSSPGKPSEEYEYIRRKIEKGVTEFWNHIRSELSKLKDLVKSNSKALSNIHRILENGADRERVLLTDMFNLSQSNGAGEWRRKAVEDLSDLVQRRLHHLQNPENCTEARKLICILDKDCGYGCQIHHVFYCLLVAYATERTLVLDSKKWRYSSGGWEKVFKPISDTCTTLGNGTSSIWRYATPTTEFVLLFPIENFTPKPKFLPQAIPEDLAPQLLHLHGAPFVWWVGQFLKYILRPQPQLQEDIDNMKEKLGFVTPIVGISARRTDKLKMEAGFHPIEEYMKHVEDWYLLYEKTHSVKRRRVYLATDDPDLLSEAEEKFPGYQFISNNNFSHAARMNTRKSAESLRGVIMDVHFLSLSNHLVCTFSSQICRLAYEIMQTYHPDASNWFNSLDDIYYYGGQKDRNQVVLYEHYAKGPDEIDLEPGDVVGIAGNHWDGYSKGINRRTGKIGLYPSYKVTEKVDIVKFPKYPKVKNHRQM